MQIFAGENINIERICDETVSIFHRENICNKYQYFCREGDVFCQRSDGVRVESGCKSSVVG